MLLDHQKACAAAASIGTIIECLYSFVCELCYVVQTLLGFITRFLLKESDDSQHSMHVRESENRMRLVSISGKAYSSDFASI